MGKLAKIGVPLLLVVAGGAGYVYWRIAPHFPDRPFDQPRGPFPVGTREYVWIDSARGEPYTKDPNDRRRLIVQVWYPAVATSGDTARYLLHPDAFADARGAKAAQNVVTNSVLDAALAATDSIHPVLIYNHGGFWTRWSATFATEWLASQGYVVFAVEHFGFNQTTRYPDGTRYVPDTLAMPKETGDGKRDALASWAYLDDPVFKIWQADDAFLLDRIAAEQRNAGPFQGRLDLDRIGMFGWSFGGALAVQMTADDPRVKAAVDHDGQLFGDVRERGTTRPVMLIHHGNDDALDYPEKQRPMVRELMAQVDQWDSTARARSTNDWYQVTIAKTEHGNFSDLTLFYPRNKKNLDPRRSHALINAYTLAFFDRYLRGKPAELLGQQPSPFPEATVHVRLDPAPPPAPIAKEKP